MTAHRLTTACYLIALACAPVAYGGARISSVEFYGTPAAPVIVVSGSGFNPSPTPLTAGFPGFTGSDFGNELIFRDTSANPNTWEAGRCNPTNFEDRDFIGLVVVSYSDTQISLQLGSDYAQFYYPKGIYQLNASDGFQLIVHGATFNGTVRFESAEARSPSLSIMKSHTGNFVQGQRAALYSIVVSNAAGVASTSGPVTITEIVPGGLSLSSMSGSGWTCSGLSCSRGDPLGPGSSYPPVTAAFSVASDAGASLTNQVTVSGGGSASASASDSTVIESASRTPVILSVLNAASYKTDIADASWVTIMGTNLAGTTRAWTADDIAGGQLPLSLDGVSVTVDGLPAAISYVSPAQINFQAPATGKLGTVSVAVSNERGRSSPASLNVRRNAPGIFVFDRGGGKYPAALIMRSDGAADYLAPPGLFGSALATRPARPDEVIQLYGTGLGPCDPPVLPGQVLAVPVRAVDPVQVSIGGQKAEVSYAGQVAPGLFQINVTTPLLPSGDQPLSVTSGGIAVQSGLFISVDSSVMLSGFVVDRLTVSGGQSLQGTLTLSGPAPPGGVEVSLASSGNAVRPPASVKVMEGATAATFTIPTLAVTANAPVTLTATYRGTSKTVSVTVLPLPPSLSALTLSSSSVQGGTSVTGRVSLSGAAPAGGASIELGANSSKIGIPTSLTVPEGQTSSSFILNTNSVSSTQIVTITATYGGTTRTATLTITPPPPPPSAWSENVNVDASVTLEGKAVHIAIQSSGVLGLAAVTTADVSSGIILGVVFVNGAQLVGNTITYQHIDSGGSTYVNTNRSSALETILSATLSLSAPSGSTSAGSGVTGTLSFSTTARSLTGTVTGIVVSHGF